MDFFRNANLTTGAVMGAASALLIFLSWPIVSEILGAWSAIRGSHAHGILMAGLIIHLLWVDRTELGGLELHPSFFPGLLLLGVASGLWLLSWGLDFRPGQVLGFYSVFVLLISGLLGRAGLQRVGTRMAILAFSLPAWFPLNPLLQSIATAVVEKMLMAAQVVAYVEGNTVSLPNGIFEIEGGCSGLGFLLASLSLVFYIVLSRRLDFRTGATCVAIATAIALVANWLRIFIIVICGYHFGMTHPIVMDHVAFGWVVYALVFFPAVYFGLGVLDRRAAPSGDQGSEKSDREQASSGVRLGAILAFVLVSVMTPALQFVIDTTESEVRTDQGSGLSYLGYESLEKPVLAWNPELELASYNRTTVHAKNGNRFMYYAAGYHRQPRERQIINEHSILVPDSWQVNHKVVKHDFTDLHATSNDKLILIRYWYNIGGEIPHSRFDAKLLRLQGKLRGRQDVSIHAFAMPCVRVSCQQAETFFDSLYDRLTS